jgi:hypothetical protein
VIFKKPVNPAVLKKILLQQCRPERFSPSPTVVGQSTAVVDAGLKMS